MSDNYNKFTHIKIRACRTCLDSYSEHNVLLNGEDWFDLLEYCVGVNIKVQDEPQTICRKCADNISNFVEFKKKCLATDLLWKSVTSDNMKCTIQNYTIDIEKSLKRQLLDTYNIINIPYEKHNQTRTENILIKNEDVEHTDLPDDDFKYEFDVPVTNSNDNYGDRLQDNDDKDLHKDVNNETSDSANGTLKCPKCNKTYGREGWLKVHMKLCGKTKEERKEIRKVNTKKKGYICGICRFTSSSEELMSHHFVEHRSRNDLECKICEFVGRDFADMVAHRFSHDSRGLKVKKSCPVCKKTILSRLPMQFHYRSAHLNKNGGYCAKCDREFSVYKTFKLHVRGHSGKKYVCDICGLRFLVKNRIIEHIQNHNETKSYICHECGKGFKRNNNLLYHMRSVHVKEEPLKCTHCNKLFKNLYTLKMHRKRLGTNSSLKCEFCGKCFAAPHLLRSHRFWHSDERPHCCEICGSRYKAKGQLKVHMQKHTGLKPFECNLCNKCFATGKQLKRHASVHTGIRPHKCPHCDRTFHSKKLILNHCASCHKLSELGKGGSGNK